VNCANHAAYLLMFIIERFEQNLAGNSAVVPAVAPLRNTHYVARENMRSFTKLEIHNVSQRRQRKSEPRPQATCTENLGKFAAVCGF